MTELDIINAMIRQEGQAPLDLIDEDHPSVTLCRDIIRQSLRALLSRGLWFNRTLLELTPDGAGVIQLADDILNIRASEGIPPGYLIRKGRELRAADGSPLTQKLRVWVTVLVDLEDLPGVAFEVLKARACLTYAADIIKDPTEEARADRNLQRAEALLSKEATRQSRYNHTGEAHYGELSSSSYRRNLSNSLAGY